MLLDSFISLKIFEKHFWAVRILDSFKHSLTILHIFKMVMS